MEIFSKIEDAIEDIKNGKIIIVVDDESRENEGDFIMASEKVTAESINFMALHGRGMICAPITKKRAKELELNLMVENTGDNHYTAFTVTVDGSKTSTGISASDRAETIKELICETTKPADLKRPGHIFPLIARDGGVIDRPGHTEAAVDLAKLAGLNPSGVICEIMNEDGTMARRDDLFKLARKFNMKFITIKDLVAYRLENEISETSVVKMPNTYGEFNLHTFEKKNSPSEEHHIALVKGDLKEKGPVLVRVHSECLTGDVFGSRRCDCGDQLDFSMKEIEKKGRGVLIYLRQEGRGIGLPNKMKAYELQERGFDTVEANHELGFETDLRDYTFCSLILEKLGVKKIDIMTNNPEKISELESKNIFINERIPIQMNSKKENFSYLKTKKEKLGHFLGPLQ